ncbi:hypothetical protein GCM10010169_15190 [Micromonospora fulviviridis]|uniref:hypothetical protein n=1 Tax=Micromonospora fulviviridis TaxID=47860 RepID=UPI00166C6E82|nr:hypothetical protein [Micromonospora fulviviridis]GGR72213.1 hypothetical protein GCM10010169_15190 [Micromonospora fulviviridis]
MKVLPWVGAAALIAGGAVVIPATMSTAADTQPSLEEDFNHPGAAQILAEHGLKLYKGDGHIMWTASRSMDDDVQCAAGEIQVEQIVDFAGTFHCFKILGGSGYLTLEIPGTFGIRGGTETVEATANLPEGQEKFTIPPNQSVPIRPGTGSEPPQAVLVEIRVD